MKAKAYKVVNVVSGKSVVTLKTLNGARGRRDKENEKAGRLVHSIRPVNPE